MLGGNRYRQITLISIEFLVAGAIRILLLARRYVTRLLGEVHKRVKSLRDSGASAGAPGGKLELISEECRRLDPLLPESRCRLVQESERKWQLERRKLKAEKSAAIATLVSGFAHEVGTPLGVIRGLAEMLLTGTFKQAEIKENLEVIIRQTDHISRMVKLLLDIGRSGSAIRVT